jgi:outer membrane protein OmpA-like peptidoglycan-associated protein
MKKISQLILPLLCAQTMLIAQPFKSVNISNVSVLNSTTLDFSPAFHKDGLVFVSNNAIEGKEKMYDKRINQKTMSLFIAKRNMQGELQKPEPFALELVTTVHEGPLTFTKDFKTLYFSRNNNQKGGKAKYVELIDRMQIYESHQTDKGWSKPKQLEFDREVKDFCHPTLSNDDRKMYFSSNRKGGFGGMDLYVSYMQSNGDWGTPQNLGPNINTDKNEVFPFIHNDGTLYFSSNKEGGTGGLDIYYARPKKDATKVYAAKGADLAVQKTQIFDEPLSIGAPFNSEKDDFGFIMDNAHKLGYLTSNRSGGHGEDDIYSFIASDEIAPNESKEREITLLVLDEKTQQPIKNAAVLLGMNNLYSNQKIVTDEQGKTKLKLNRFHDYEIRVDKSTYDDEQLSFAKDDTRNEIIVILKQLDVAEHNIILKVLDKNTRQPLSNALVNWGQKNLLTDKEGKVTLSVNRTENYNIKVDKMAYTSERLTLIKEDAREEIEVLLAAPNNTDVVSAPRNNSADVPTPTRNNNVDVVSTPNNPSAPVNNTNSEPTPAREVNRSDYPSKPKPVGEAIKPHKPAEITLVSNEVYKLNNIYYDFDKDRIRPDARRTLDSLITILNTFADMEIELIAHTDSRGSNRYNENLSQRRAVNAEKYLVENGIPKSRIVHTSRGENELTNDCGDNVPCNNKKHQLNRRTEVHIIKSGSAEGRVIEN